MRRVVARSSSLRLAMPSVAMLLLGGCVLAPEGTVEEQAKLNKQSATFEPQVDLRQLPPVPTPAHWRDVLRRHFSLTASWNRPISSGRAP